MLHASFILLNHLLTYLDRPSSHFSLNEQLCMFTTSGGMALSEAEEKNARYPVGNSNRLYNIAVATAQL